MAAVDDTTPVKVFLTDSTDHMSGKTGISAPTVYYHKPGGTATALDSPTWSEIDATNMAGWYLLTPTAGMVDTAGELAIEVSATGCDRFHKLLHLEEAAAAGGGATAQEVWEYGTRALTDKAGFALSSAALAAITTAVEDLETYGLQALHAILTSSGVKVGTNADKTGYSGTATNMVTAPDNASIAAILEDTASTLPGTLATIDGIIDAILALTGTTGVVVAPASKTGYALTEAYDHAKDDILSPVQIINGVVEDILEDTGITLPLLIDGLDGVISEGGADNESITLILAAVSNTIPTAITGLGSPFQAGNWVAPDNSSAQAAAASAASADEKLTAPRLARIDGAMQSSEYVVPLSDAATRAALGLATANLDEQLAALSTSFEGYVEGDTYLNELTRLDSLGNIVDAPNGSVLGISTPGASIGLFAVGDLENAQRHTTVGGDGTWSLWAPSGTFDLVVTKNGYYDASDNDSAIVKRIIVP